MPDKVTTCRVQYIVPILRQKEDLERGRKKRERLLQG